MPDSNAHPPPAAPAPAPAPAVPTAPTFSAGSASATAASLATMLSTQIQEADTLRIALAQERTERQRLEKIVGHISDPDRATLVRRMQECEARADRAEKAREEAEARVQAMKVGWVELEKYIQMLDVRAADARASYARGFLTDRGAGGGASDSQPNGLSAQSRTVSSPAKPHAHAGPEPAPFDRRIASIPRSASALLSASAAGLPIHQPAPTIPRVRPRHDSFTSLHPPPSKRSRADHADTIGHTNGTDTWRKPAARTSHSPQPPTRTEATPSNKPISLSSTSARAQTITPPPEAELRARRQPSIDDVDSELVRALSGPTANGKSKTATASNAGSTRRGSDFDDDDITGGTGTADGDVEMLDDIAETGQSDDEIDGDGDEGDEPVEEDELDIDEMILAASAPRMKKRSTHPQSSNHRTSRVTPGATPSVSTPSSTLKSAASSQPHLNKGNAGAAPAGTLNAQGLRCCLNCGEPGRYKDGRCVEKWGPGPGGPGTVCDRCRKKIKRTERKDGTSSSQSQSQSQPQLSFSQATHPLSSQQTTAFELSSQSTSGPSQSQPNSSGRSTQASQLSQSQSSRPVSPAPRPTTGTVPAGTSQNTNGSTTSSAMKLISLSNHPTPNPRTATTSAMNSNSLPAKPPSQHAADSKFLSVPSTVASASSVRSHSAAVGVSGSKSSRSMTGGSSGSPLTPEPRGAGGMVKMEEGEEMVY